MNDGETARKVRARAIDVARAAGVSQSAVSRTFTPGGSVSDAVRERVVKAAKRLGYRPNAFARAITTRRSNVIGIVEAIDTNLHYPEVLAELSRTIANQGMHLMLFTVDKMSEISKVVDHIWSYQIDGVVVLLGLGDQNIKLLEEHDVPVVLFNRRPSDYNVSAVTCDHRACGQMIGKRLIAAGRRQFGLIHGPEASTVAIERIAGVREALIAGGIDSDDIRSSCGDFSYESGSAAAAELLCDAGGSPDAIIAANDMMALGAIDYARHEAGLEIPASMSVVGFDGIGAAQWRSFQLTTVRQPIRRMAEATINVLRDRIDDPTMVPELRVLPGAIVDGETG